MKKNIIINFLLSILFLPLLYLFVYINTEYLFQFELWNSLTIVYLIYMVISVLIMYFSLKIKDNTLKSEVYYLWKFFLYFLLLILPWIYLNHTFIVERLSEVNLYLRSYWRVAFFYFALALVVSPFLNFVKKENIKENLILSRKVFWIISFLFFLKHWLEYFSAEFIYQYSYHKDVSYIKYTYDNLLTRWDALSGILPGILMIVLGLTSNKISLKILWGKWWKNLQSFVYPAFLLSIIHIAFASRMDNFYIFLAWFVVIIRLVAFNINSSKQTSWKTTKYKCIPCWFIYDETMWDPDSGISPWTKFEDIPDTWMCPVCWVTKADFEPFYEWENTIFGGYIWEIVWYNMLTEDVLELELKLDQKVEVIPWQYASVILNDFDSDFTRSFSIVANEWNNLKFAIKLKIDWRWWRKLKTLKIWDKLKIKWIYGNFVVKQTTNPKVFIASGTWLAPMINMLKACSRMTTKELGDFLCNKLYFWVRWKSDVFYEEILKSFPNLEVNIFLSKEEVEWYNFGRMDVSKYDFDKNTEFYICWNPWLVADTYKSLEEKWYKNIYSEKFN
jgi:rubredoxin/ferredoxin-NADP reductase/DMSO/TMAO reductase YedYZ heme-binding membrane subunit